MAESDVITAAGWVINPEGVVSVADESPIGAVRLLRTTLRGQGTEAIVHRCSKVAYVSWQTTFIVRGMPLPDDDRYFTLQLSIDALRAKYFEIVEIVKRPTQT